MRVTLKQIAELAGVSRGTVDRALNDRGRVNSEVAQRIKKIAKDLGYQPNTAGRALAMSKNPIIIGVILQSIETPFMKEVLTGVNSACEEIELLGGKVLIRSIKSINPFEVAAAMDELHLLGVQALAMVPSSDKIVCGKIDEFVTKLHIPVVTLNIDAPDTKRALFVGQNTLKSGHVAAGLMGEILGGQGIVSVITAHASHPALENRIKGFREVMEKCYPDIEILPIEYAYDDIEQGKEIAGRQMKEYPGMNGFFITSNEDCGVCQVLQKMGLNDKIKVICYDLTKSNVQNLKNGSINFLIGQNGFVQGYEPVMILFRKFFQEKEPEQEFFYTDIEIKTKYNI